MKYSEIVKVDALMTLRSAAFDACKEYGKHINDTTELGEVERLKNVVNERISKYTDACKAYVYKAWLDTDSPVKSALLDGVYPALTMKAKGKKGNQTVSIEDDTRVFAVPDFFNFAIDNGYEHPAKDKAWLKYAEEAHKALCGFLVAEMHSEGLKAQFLVEFDSAFHMKAGNDNCGEVDFAKRYSKGNIDRTLQALLDAILYEDATKGGKNKYVVKNKDRNALLYTYAKLDAKTIGKILFGNTTAFMANVTKVFAMVVRGGEYSFDKYPVATEK